MGVYICREFESLIPPADVLVLIARDQFMETLLMKRILSSIAAVTLLALTGMGQMPDMHPASAHPAKPIELLPGFGTLHHKVSTRNRRAQQFFDQGLRMIYGFNHDEAVLSFQRAAELDPQLAMAYWGIGYASGPNINKGDDPESEKAAYDATQMALKLAVNATAKERAYIEALAKRYSITPGANLKHLAVDFRDAMHELSEKYPNDLDAATLYAESMMDLHPWQLWANDGTPTEGTSEIVKVLESVLKRNPNHVGAIHYYIHTVEASPHPELALPYVAKLPAQMPAAGHLVHMPSHTYIRTGDYLAAARSNADAIVADDAYISRTGANGFGTIMLHNHNIHFLAVANSMAGNYQASMKAARLLEKNMLPLAKEMPMVEGFLVLPSQLMVRFHKWEEILQLPEPPAERTMARVNWHYVRAVAFAETGKVDDSEREFTSFKESVTHLSPRASLGLNTASAVLAIAENVIAARIALTKKDDAAAIEALTKAVAAEDALDYDEPSDWISPVREQLGGVLLRKGNNAEAERVFRADLIKNPNNARSLFGLAECLKAQGNVRDAAKIRRQFAVNWRKSDSKLTLADL